MERLLRGRKYLRTIVSRSAPKEADQLFPQGSPGETNCNFSAYQFRFANGQAYSQAYHQAETRPTSSQRKQTG